MNYDYALPMMRCGMEFKGCATVGSGDSCSDVHTAAGSARVSCAAVATRLAAQNSAFALMLHTAVGLCMQASPWTPDAGALGRMRRALRYQTRHPLPAGHGQCIGSPIRHQCVTNMSCVPVLYELGRFLANSVR